VRYYVSNRVLQEFVPIGAPQLARAARSAVREAAEQAQAGDHEKVRQLCAGGANSAREWMGAKARPLPMYAQIFRVVCVLADAVERGAIVPHKIAESVRFRLGLIGRRKAQDYIVIEALWDAIELQRSIRPGPRSA
jgi:hypothetical protein